MKFIFLSVQIIFFSGFYPHFLLFAFYFWSRYFLEHVFSILMYAVKYPKKIHFWKD